jgi:hypothetical protein
LSTATPWSATPGGRRAGASGRRSNHDPFYTGLRPLNSLEILTYLKIAEHITGDAK